MKIADVLEKAADLIEPEGAWIKGFYRDVDGDGVTCRFCLAGALMHIDGSSYEAWQAVYPPLLGFASWPDVSAWNDAPERTQPEVVAKLREAAAKAREQGL